MVKLSRDTEISDSLNVLAANERRLELTLTSVRPLRKPQTRMQTKQLAELRRHVTTQIFDQLDKAARRTFRGPVAVEIRLALPADRHAAHLPTVVKDYLDVLKGPVIFDDATVEHLLVLRAPSPASGTEVLVRCLPLRLFAADYDRVFRVLPEYEDVTAAPETKPAPGELWTTPEWGYGHFDKYARERLRYDQGQLRYIQDLDAEEDHQLAEDPDADVYLDLRPGEWELADPDVRAAWREHLESSIAKARGDWVSDQGLDARDRPGPAPAWLDETRALDIADVLELNDGGPGCLVLPAPWEHPTPAGQPRWSGVVEREFLKLRSGALAQPRVSRPGGA